MEDLEVLVATNVARDESQLVTPVLKDSFVDLEKSKFWNLSKHAQWLVRGPSFVAFYSLHIFISFNGKTQKSIRIEIH